MFSNKRITAIVLLMLFTSVIVVGCAGEQQAKEEEKWPTQNINGTIAWGAGGGTDSVSRLLSPVAEKELGVSIVLSNKTGATGTIATQYVYDQKADGYNLLFNAENPQIYQVLGLSNLSYDDFEPILLSVQGMTVVVVHKDSPYKTLDDLLDDAKERPGKINIGISGVGGQPYMTANILKKGAGVDFNPVTFDGDGPLITALLGKQVDVTGLAISAASQYIRTGDFRGLCIVANNRNPALPEVPALGELKPEFQSLLRAPGFFYGVFVKKGTPEDIIKKLTDAYMVAFEDAKFQEYCTNNGLIPLGLTGKEAREYMNTWRSTMSWLIYESGTAKHSPEEFGIPKP